MPEQPRTDEELAADPHAGLPKNAPLSPAFDPSTQGHGYVAPDGSTPNGAPLQAEEPAEEPTVLPNAGQGQPPAKNVDDPGDTGALNHLPAEEPNSEAPTTEAGEA